MADSYFHHVYRQYVADARSNPGYYRATLATPISKEDLMDHKVVSTDSEGQTLEQFCATQTDVENHLVYLARKANADQCKLVSITIANLWVQN